MLAPRAITNVIDDITTLIDTAGDFRSSFDASFRTASGELDMPKIVTPLQHRDTEFEAKVAELCSAVKVVASVIDDQLAQPKDGPILSDHGFEVQTFVLDRQVVRYAVDHAADLALDLRNMTM
jgi:hypothetical protein